MDPLIDAMAGNYRLVSRLGAGGMGEVYKGIHATIGSKVAIKLLHATAVRDREAQQRFLLEAKAVNRVEHPGVVKVIDAGRMENGRPYLVMELLDGASLHDLRTKLSIVDACEIMADVLDALAAAHAAGVVHRDLKPANIFRTRDGRVVVLDFGVAKLMSPDAPARLTVTGSAVGTPHYMAPEQIRGKEITPAVDIYAAGVVLFELVCGRRPFDGDEESVMLGHLERRPPPPRALEPAVPVVVQDIILAALAKDPARRHANAAAMRDALRAALHDTQPVTPSGTSPAPPVSPAPPAPAVRSPWARPSSAESPEPATASTVRALPPPNPTEPDRTPPAVIADRRRSRTRTYVIFGSLLGAAALASIAFAIRGSSSKRHARATPPAIDAGVVVVATDATVAPPAAGCASLVRIVPFGVPGARHAEVQATYFRRCEEDRWAPPVIACFLGAQSADDHARCTDALSAEQRAHLDTALGVQPAKKRLPKRPAADDDLLPPKTIGRGAADQPTRTYDPFAEAHPSDADAATDGLVEIASDPAGAAVYIDGKRFGVTPWSGKVTTGRHQVTLALAGFNDQASTIDVDAHRLTAFRAVLAKAKTDQ